LSRISLKNPSVFHLCINPVHNMKYWYAEVIFLTYTYKSLLLHICNYQYSSLEHSRRSTNYLIYDLWLWLWLWFMIMIMIMIYDLWFMIYDGNRINKSTCVTWWFVRIFKRLLVNNEYEKCHTRSYLLQFYSKFRVIFIYFTCLIVRRGRSYTQSKYTPISYRKSRFWQD
jgi:hypothetical protein